MAELRVKSRSEYVICVNDAGDTISFDPMDAGLTTKFVRAFERIEALTKDYEGKAAAISAREDEPYSTITKTYLNAESETTITITKNQKDMADLETLLYAKARDVLDSFLGENACQKIFGSKNWPTMFSDLAEQLEPHMEKIGLNVGKLRAETAKKYAPGGSAGRLLK